MTEESKEKIYTFLDKSKYDSQHKQAFNDIYQYIKSFSEESRDIYKSDLELYLHKALCSAPGHGKTTALEYHIKTEVYQNQRKKDPYLLVFNNNDNMNTFYELIHSFAQSNKLVNAILAVNDENYEECKQLIQDFQIVCITQQRFRDLALGLGSIDTFLKYQQERLYWGKNPFPNKKDKSTVKRTIIVDEMPIFFNPCIFDISSENNSVDWFDALAANTDDQKLIPEYKRQGRQYINKLINRELDNNGSVTKRLIRFYEGTDREDKIRYILENLNPKGVSNDHVLKYKWFMKLLDFDSVGAINRTHKKTMILCSEYINYTDFGNILILDGTSNLVTEFYRHGGYEVVVNTNYHDYKEKLLINWRKINTSSNARSDRQRDIKDQISFDIKQIRDRTKKKGYDVLPIPAKGDIDYYIQSGAISQEQYEKFFKGRSIDNQSLAINLMNVTGKNDLSSYNSIALLNLPILPPHEYKLKAIAMYGTDTDLRMVKEIDDSEEKKQFEGQWFVNPFIQLIFEQMMKAELSQIIHRSSIRFINSTNKVVVILYHNKEYTNELLKEIFNISNEHIVKHSLEQDNKFREKCKKKAQEILQYLKQNPNTEYTAGKIGGTKFKKWIHNHWNENEDIIIEIFKQYNITIRTKNNNYRYFSFIDDGVFNDT
ncbi:hypothetical protein [Metabacillus litoralis]|uniref:hypothetical protein n=1 Tax=Metabacillus litoralis TaxID=152268 RepID=UPI00203AB2C4|nr:hypothetical protein [Metabacillus litoralis]MCM3161014.1 hypothetical protein [Metabacillus litoralis]